MPMNPYLASRSLKNDAASLVDTILMEMEIDGLIGNCMAQWYGNATVMLDETSVISTAFCGLKLEGDNC